MRICLDARFVPGAFGGVEPAALALVESLVARGGAEFTLLTYRGHEPALTPATREQVRTIEVEPPRAGLLSRLTAPIARVPSSDGSVERAGVDVIHFTYQNGFRTRIPSLYQPWDLQHVHLPQFFSRRERAIRSRWYRELAAQAAVVVVASEWACDDVVANLQLPRKKVRVVAPGPASFASRVERTGDGDYALYPASTHPHKNHERLFEALARLRDSGVVVPLVCTGIETRHAPTVRRRVAELGLEEQVRFRGYVDDNELATLYARARCLVFPSLFEGWGLPIVEAFAAGVPVVCSTATSLPELAGGAAVLFDPYDVGGMAGALERVWTDVELRSRLVVRGRERAQTYTWPRAAEEFSALYAEVTSATRTG